MNTTHRAKQQRLAQLRLHELLHYEPSTGVFTWLVRRGRAKAGTAGSKHAEGYIEIGVDGYGYLAHRLAWLYMTASWPAHDVDHINGVRSDNRFSKLRDVVRQVNLQNMQGPKPSNKTGVLGVVKKRGLFVASIRSKGKRLFLGSFHTAEAAGSAYLLAKRSLHEGCTI